MGKGVKKIAMVKGLYYPNKSVPGQRITIKPDQWVWFQVKEWGDATTNEDKKKNITWMRQDKDREIIISRMSVASANKYGFKIPKSLCGSYHYYIEASWSGKRDFNNTTGLYVNGWCEPKIISSKWSIEKTGIDITNTKDDNKGVGYGDTIFLHIKTEGLNGDTVAIEIWNEMWRGNYKIETIPNVTIIDGEINLKIPNTAQWRSKIKNIQDNEEFYFKVIGKDGKYIKNNNGKNENGKYLNIKEILKSSSSELPSNLTPTTIYKPDKTLDRYEPCKFETIKITESKISGGKAKDTTVVIFDNGKGLEKLTNPPSKEYIERVIYFKFDSTIIDKDGLEKLNNILKFLLEHEGSIINLNGYACVIGKQDYNKGLSQKRADIVKKFFIDGGLDARRIISVGKGEFTPTDDKMGRDDIKYKNEKEYENNRRVDISFLFEGHNAETIIYETIAPSKSSKKNITIEITGMDTKNCFREKDKHINKIEVIDVGQVIDAGDTTQVFNPPAFNYKIYSDLSNFNVFPIQYIWPATTDPNQFHLHIHSCRYYTNKKKATALIKVYPDIKWTLAVEFLVNVSNYKHANMPAGEIFKKHQEKSRQAGYERWQINEKGKIPILIGLNLSAEWNNGNSRRALTSEFSDTINLIAKIIAKSINILQKVINNAQSVSKTASIPIGFDIRYPNFVMEGKWYLERINNLKTINTVGEVGFALKPLIGAEVFIDILGAAIAAASYGTTANPAAAKIINQFRGSLENLGAKVVFSATFSGALEIEVEALKIDSINGIKMGKKSTIGGEFGVKIELSIALEIGKIMGKKKEVIAKFKAGAQADAYFGGEILMDSDKIGLFIEPLLRFSGLLFTLEIEGELGWWKSSFSIKEKVLEGEDLYLGRKYFK